MAGNAPAQVLPDDAVVVTANGKRYLFPDRAAARAFLTRPMTEDERERLGAVLDGLPGLREQILRDTDGVGIPDAVLDEVLQEVRER